MKVRIISHNFCKRPDCSFKGKTGEVKGTCDEAVKDDSGKITTPKSLWVRLENGVLAKFLEIDYVRV